jgi:hypothetical protein
MQPGYVSGYGVGGGPGGYPGGQGYVTIKYIVDESMRGE